MHEENSVLMCGVAHAHILQSVNCTLITCVVRAFRCVYMTQLYATALIGVSPAVCGWGMRQYGSSVHVFSSVMGTR